MERLKAQNAALKASEDEPQAKATATPEVGCQPSANAASAPNADPNKPCENYKVDMAAANFGDCKCGFPKKDHVPSAFASRGAKPAGQMAAVTRPQTAPADASAQAAAMAKEAAEKAVAEKAAAEKAAAEGKAAAEKAAAEKAVAEKAAAEKAVAEKAAAEEEPAAKAAAAPAPAPAPAAAKATGKRKGRGKEEPEPAGTPLELCALILGALTKRKDAYWFAEPVPKDTEGYFEMISSPMDYGSIQTKLEAAGYPDADAFASDVRLVTSNAVTYSPEADNACHKAARASEFKSCQIIHSLMLMNWLC